MGSRFLVAGGTEDMTTTRRIGNSFFLFLINTIWNTHYTDVCYGYRAFKKSAVKRLGLKSNGFDIETEISIKCAKKGLKVLEVPSFEKKRKSGKSRLNTIRDGFLILRRIFLELFRK